MLCPLQAEYHDHEQGWKPKPGDSGQESRQLSPARLKREQGQAPPEQIKQAKPGSSSPHSAQTQPDHLGSYGLPYQAATARPAHRFDDATDLASSPAHDQGLFTAAQSQQGPSQPQFMSGLMALHGITTPEEKRKREDKQKQYARELDEQVLHLSTWHSSICCLLCSALTWQPQVSKLHQLHKLPLN